MTAMADIETQYAWSDLLEAHAREPGRAAGKSFVIVVADGSGMHDRLIAQHARTLVDARHLALVPLRERGELGTGVAILRALVEILIEDPDATVVVIRTGSTSDDLAELQLALARAYYHVGRAPDTIVVIDSGVLVGRGRPVFELFARAMPRVARLFAHYAAMQATA